MSDISTIWNRTRGDYVQAGADLQTNDDLLTAVTISLFTDRVAAEDDPIPDGSGDRRGWWADTEQYPIGSRLWQLDRAKRTQATLAAAQTYIEEALQWLIDDGVVAQFGIYIEWQAQNTLAAQVTAFRNDGTKQPMAFAWVWDSTH